MEAERLIEEIREITIQYKAEVGSQRKPWPKAIKIRIEKLFDLGWKAPKIAEATGVPYFSILHWRSRERKKFHALEVKALTVQESAAVTVADANKNHKSSNPATVTVVTVTTPDGFQIKIDGLDAGLEILRRLRSQKCF